MQPRQCLATVPAWDLEEQWRSATVGAGSSTRRQEHRAHGGPGAGGGSAQHGRRWRRGTGLPAVVHGGLVQAVAMHGTDGGGAWRAGCRWRRGKARAQATAGGTGADFFPSRSLNPNLSRIFLTVCSLLLRLFYTMHPTAGAEFLLHPTAHINHMTWLNII